MTKKNIIIIGFGLLVVAFVIIIVIIVLSKSGSENAIPNSATGLFSDQKKQNIEETIELNNSNNFVTKQF